MKSIILLLLILLVSFAVDGLGVSKRAQTYNFGWGNIADKDVAYNWQFIWYVKTDTITAHNIVMAVPYDSNGNIVEYKSAPPFSTGGRYKFDLAIGDNPGTGGVAHWGGDVDTYMTRCDYGESAKPPRGYKVVKSGWSTRTGGVSPSELGTSFADFGVGKFGKGAAYSLTGESIFTKGVNCKDYAGGIMSAFGSTFGLRP